VNQGFYNTICLPLFTAMAMLLAVAPWLGWTGGVRQPGALLAVASGAGSLYLLGALAVAVASAFSPRVFCRWLCPAGTCQDALACRMRRRAWVGRVPQVGAGVVFIGVGAALAGYPLFGWLDPLALFNAAFGVARRDLGAWDWAAAAGFPLLLAAALLAPGLWCGRLCPLGALQDLVRVPLRLAVRGDARSSGLREKEASALSRRVFLGLGLGAGYRLALPPGREAAPAVLRPPVSGPSARFTRLCVRCGACVRACPNGIIQIGGAGTGWAGVLAPEISFEGDHCPASCTACGQACPTGAIPKFTPEEKLAHPMGVARVNHEECLLGIGRDCGACATACPREALDLAWDRVEMVSRVVVDAKACTGCGYCEYVCPSAPRAITVKPLRSA
jgi:ferredoxin-type protein NapF